MVEADNKLILENLKKIGFPLRPPIGNRARLDSGCGGRWMPSSRGPSIGAAATTPA
jgi:hypothetical protein